ncbi:MAG: ROK family protein [Clostridia bacterium]|nr:ROK family protein [Clostridia bacterium]
MYILGIDLGGTNIAIGLCNERLEILDKDSVPTCAEREGEEIVCDMAALCKKIIDRNGLTVKDIARVGIATPGSIDDINGIVEYSNNLKMENFPITEIFKKYFPAERVYIANDANAAALAEDLAGAAKGSRVSLMITLGTGVGGGVIINHKIYAGSANGGGTELGHTVICSGGRQCTCGRRGCLEAYASATALTEMTEQTMYGLKIKGIPSKLFEVAKKEGKVSARTAFDAMRLGDPYGQKLVDDYIFYLAEGVTNMINIFQPDVLTIGGGVCNEKDYLMIPLLRHVERDQYTRDSKNKTKIMIAKLKNDAGIIGAAGLGCEA